MSKITKETNKLCWHWELDFKDTLVIFIMWGWNLELKFWYMSNIECLICLSLDLLT